MLWPLLRPLLRSWQGWLLLLLVIAAAYAFELQQREKMSYAGIPQSSSWSLANFTHVLRNQGFLIGYSEWRADPLWVIYRLDRSARSTRHLPRPSHFRSDWRTLRRVAHEDYRRSGYDRGHMAPNRAMAALYGERAQQQSFLMSNVVPQRPRLNQRLWQRLEEMEFECFTRKSAPLWVITGPIFDARIERLDSGVEIPDAFYKIYVAPAGRAGKMPRLLAFLIPQNVRGDEPLQNFLTSVDEIERRTGLDFFPRMDESQERILESRREHDIWRCR